MRRFWVRRDGLSFVLALAAAVPLAAQGSPVVAPCNAMAVGPEQPGDSGATGDDAAGSGKPPGGPADASDTAVEGAAVAAPRVTRWQGHVLVNIGPDWRDHRDTVSDDLIEIPIVEEPQPTVSGLNDRLFFEDDGRFAFLVRNDAEPAEDPCDNESMPVRVSVIGNFGFMDLPPVQTFSLGPGSGRWIDVDMEDFLDYTTLGGESRWLSPDYDEDRLAGAEVEVVAGTLKRSFYVYRFIDAADSDPLDETLEFADTANPWDLSDNVVRERNLTLRFSNTKMYKGTKFTVDDDTHFGVKAERGGTLQNLSFDPLDVANDLQAKLEIESPTGTKWPVDLEGDGVLQQVYVDTGGMSEALKAVYERNKDKPQARSFVSYLSDDAGVAATIEEILFDVEIRLASVAPGVEISTIDSSGILFDVFTTAESRQVHNDPPIGFGVTFGYGNGTISERGVNDNVDFGADGKPKTNDDDAGLLEDLVAWRPFMSDSEAAFRLTEILNEHDGERVDLYIGRLADQAGDRDRMAYVAGKTMAHEIGHAVGLNHTGNVFSKKGLKLVRVNGNELDFEGDFEPTPDFYKGFYVTVGYSDEKPKKPGIGYVVTGYQPTAGGGRFQVARDNPEDPENPDPGGPFKLNGQMLVAGGNTGEDSDDYRYDLMTQGADPTGAFEMDPISVGAFRLALGTEWDDTDAEDALDLVERYVHRPQAAGEWADAAEPGGAAAREPWELLPPLLSLSDGSGRSLRALTAEAVVGAGAERRAVVLSNAGDAELEIARVAVEPGRGWRLTGAEAPLTIGPRSSRGLEVVFAPDAAGPDEAVLVVASNSRAGERRLPLIGRGRSPGGDLQLSIDNNNLGGVALSNRQRRVEDLARIENVGAGPLRVDRILLHGASSAQFRLVGLPPGFSPRQPLVLAPGESRSFGVVFDPRFTGLQKIGLRIESDDADSPATVRTVIGTGLADRGTALDWGGDFVLFETTSSGPQRLVSGADGRFEHELPAEQNYMLAFFDPVSGLIAQTAGTSAPAGRPTVLSAPIFDYSRAPDSDGDGLPDDVERVIGTSPAAVDSDGDGTGDFDEIPARPAANAEVAPGEAPEAGPDRVLGALAELADTLGERLGVELAEAARRESPGSYFLAFTVAGSLPAAAELVERVTGVFEERGGKVVQSALSSGMGQIEAEVEIGGVRSRLRLILAPGQLMLSADSLR